MVIIQLNSGRFFVGKCATFLLMCCCLFLPKFFAILCAFA